MNTRQIGVIVAGALVMLGLCACDSETTAASDSPAMSVLESGKKLDDCTKENEGAMVYVSGSAVVFYCAEGKWQTLNDKDVASEKNGGKITIEKDKAPVHDTIIINRKDTVIFRDTVVRVNRDTVVIKEFGGPASPVSSSSSGNSGSSVISESSVSGASLAGKPNWVYLNPAINYGEMTDDRDGQVYKTVKIGSQVWMAESLNFLYKVINEGTGKAERYGNESCSKCEIFGRYYTWAAAMDSAGVYSENGKGCGYGLECTPVYPVRGVCPKGWHLPDSIEWRILFETANVEGALQAVGYGSNWPYASNSTGFSAIPAGNVGGSYTGISVFFWSSSELDSGKAFRKKMDKKGLKSNELNNYPDSYKSNEFSVRCIQD